MAKKKARVEYRWKSSSMYKIGAQLVGECLENIKALNGTLTAGAVVDSARDPDHPLHGYFEWDDKVAAEEFRLKKARDLINHIVTVRIVDSSQEPKEFTAFHNIKVRNEETNKVERYYEELDVVTDSSALKAQVLKNAMRSLRHWVAEYKGYQELWCLVNGVEELLRNPNLPLE